MALVVPWPPPHPLGSSSPLPIHWLVGHLPTVAVRSTHTDASLLLNVKHIEVMNGQQMDRIQNSFQGSTLTHNTNRPASSSSTTPVLQQGGHCESGGSGPAGETALQCGHQLRAGAQFQHSPLSHLGLPQSP